jgi:hypothetical protein
MDPLYIYRFSFYLKKTTKDPPDDSYTDEWQTVVVFLGKTKNYTLYLYGIEHCMYIVQTRTFN